GGRPAPPPPPPPLLRQIGRRPHRARGRRPLRRPPPPDELAPRRDQPRLPPRGAPHATADGGGAVALAGDLRAQRLQYPPGGRTPMRLYAFEGLHYTPRAGDAGELAAPPYDQINDAARDRFHTQSPHQFVHLTRPVAPEGGDPYRFAAALQHRWLKEGFIERDPQPAIYPYVIELAGGGERLGLLGLIRYEDPTVIRPHEQTLEKAIADRTALLEATRA